jgi:cardiolipin synthase A/B
LNPPQPADLAGPPEGAFIGGHRVALLQGGDELFPAMQQAMAEARQHVWLTTYIFHDDEAGQAVAEALCAAARRGVEVHVVVDGFGSLAALPWLRQRLAACGVMLDVFRPLDRWTAWLQPAQLRRLHHKLCVVDDAVAFVGGINILDDRFDLSHGRSTQPRLDFAIELRGPVVPQVRQLAQADGLRARLGKAWRSEVGALARSRTPMADTLQLLRGLRGNAPPGEQAHEAPHPVRAAFVVRDNLKRRRDIERSYLEAVRGARHSVDRAAPFSAACWTRRSAACACAC